MNQRELATAAGLDFGYLSKIENKGLIPARDKIEAFIKALKLPPATHRSSLERALRDPRGTPPNYPHSAWELLDHIRRTQRDLLELCTNPKYHEPRWPDDYWPGSPGPSSDAAWTECLAAIRADAQALADFAVTNAATLAEKIPHGTDQTYLRTVLVAVDHASYHAGQIVAVRRLLGAWPP